MTESLRIVHAGTPAFAVPPLEALLSSGHRVEAVVSQPDRPAGRGRRLQPPPLKQAAIEAGLSVIQPERLTRADLEAVCGGSRPDLLVVVAFGQLLPSAVLEYPRFGAVNVHASLLPRWRGAAPIARALMAGDGETGVTIMRMTEELDAGPVLLQRHCPIEPRDTAATLHDRLAVLGASALRTVLDDLPGHLRAARPQDEAGVTHAARLTREDGRIDWQADAGRIERQVRALQPRPVAWTLLDGAPLRVWGAEVRAGDPPDGVEPGTVLQAGRDGIDVATGDGVLRLLVVQQAGRRAVSAGDLANARELDRCRLGR